MTNEEERIEAVVWGQQVKIAMVSIIPLLLILLLALDAYLLMKHSKEVTKATDDAAQFIVKDAHETIERQQAELRAENTNRSHEHNDILKLMNALVMDQNEMFLQAIAKKAQDDTKQHVAIERAVIRACHATDKQMSRLTLLARDARALYVDTSLLGHLNEQGRR